MTRKPRGSNPRNLTAEQIKDKRQKAKKNYWENAEEQRRKKREQYESNRESILKRNAEYHKKHYVPKPKGRKTEEEIKEYDRKRNSEYHKTHKDEIRERKKKYREDHPEIFQSQEFKQNRQEHSKNYYQTHKEHWIMTREKMDRANELERKRRAESVEERIKHREEVKLWQKANPDKRKANRLKVYGMTLEEFNDLLTAQGGKCAICGMSDTSDPKVFPFVDHCHSQKHVRGILCINCNHGIGQFKDSPALLRKAAKYVERNGLFGPISK